jgi:hypothetical protein
MSSIGVKEYYKSKKAYYGSCEGCVNIGFRYPFPSMYPCNNCVRANMKDYYDNGVKEDETLG